MERVCVLGAGSWGTTMAALLAEKGFQVSLWVRGTELSGTIAGTRENKTYLPGIRLPENLRPTNSFDEALKDASFVVCAVPSHGVRAVFCEARAFIPEGSIIVSLAKGLEEGTNLTVSGILNDCLKGIPHKGIVVVSGPSFAKEVSLKLPTAVCAASASNEATKMVQNSFSTPFFRIYTNTDVTGVELGGALKNVIAIGSGISDGLGLGNNARAALITRGLAEITRLGVRLGATPLTFAGLSGLGDLVLTCTARLSRNYSLGFDIGQGKNLEEIKKGMCMVAEGIKTSGAAVALASIHKIEMPITEEVYNILYKNKPARDAVYELMTRRLKGE